MSEQVAVDPVESDGVFRAGFAALVGRPNVGKSTLLNALVGEKLSIVTPRPQTTRHRVLGLLHLPEAQIAFVDTPGLHHGGKRALNRAMNRAASAAALDADVVVLVVEALRFNDEDALALERASTSGKPVIAAVNKVDQVANKPLLLPFLAELATRAAFVSVIPLSAKRRVNLDALKSAIVAALPLSPPLYAATDKTDRDLKFRIAEVVREKLTLELNQEVPYGIALEVEAMERDAEQLAIGVIIWVDRAGQKPIVIGPKGARLKRVGSSARRELNAMLGERVHLTLWVKVREGWADNLQALKSMGLE